MGTPALVTQTCRLCAATGADTTLLTYGSADTTSDDTFRFRVVRTPRLPGWTGRRSGPTPHKPLFDLLLVHRLTGLLRDHAPDILHAHHVEALLACVLADPAGRIPLVFHQHALLEPELPTYARPSLSPLLCAAGRIADRTLPRAADHIICLCADSERRMIGHGFPADHISLLRPAVVDIPPSRHTPSSRRSSLTAVYTGNLDRYQNVDTLLRAAALVDRNHPGAVRLRIVTAEAPPSTEPAVPVEYLPHGDFNHAWRCMIDADFAVIPRCLPGGVPIKLVNALAAGMPVIVDRRIGEELVTDDEALLVDAGDPQRIAEAMVAMTDPALRRRLHGGALRAADRLYGAGVAKETLAQIYRTVESSSYRRK